MNLFRSGEHARNWSGFDPAQEGGLLTLAQILEIFGAQMFRARGAQDYLSQLPELRKGFMKTIAEVTGGHPFWGIPGH